MSVPDHVKVAIIGGGPGGLSAAIYAARAGLEPYAFLGIETSSQLLTTTHVENYPGFKSILGPDLIQNMLDQAEHCGTHLIYEDVTKLDLSSRPFKISHGYEGHTVLADTLIFGTGAKAMRLDVPGEKQFWQKGISACAVCDSMMAKGKVTVVVGGGDVACEEAIYLTQFAERVIMILRRDVFRASGAMVRRVLNNPKIQVIYDSGVNEIKGDKKINKIIVKNFKTNELTEYDVGALFWAVGHKPMTDLVAGQVNMDGGYIKLTKGQATNVPGFFACGDCCDPIYRQAVCSAGTGAAAALDAERFLGEQE
ncbi:Thioredoxin_reductase [Hexamita inflata]|uniref:Thioredoxin reductase n=1 Tax=Hexamita inflata TaxID=28002 RepID=A0AA86TV69_9EUKA|nr:Thioredoxin reductase [Hexamita inflata]